MPTAALTLERILAHTASHQSFTQRGPWTQPTVVPRGGPELSDFSATPLLSRTSQGCGTHSRALAAPLSLCVHVSSPERPKQICRNTVLVHSRCLASNNSEGSKSASGCLQGLASSRSSTGGSVSCLFWLLVAVGPSGLAATFIQSLSSDGQSSHLCASYPDTCHWS